jgi:glycosyltransferase involved in cell wall biosynthesis
LRIAYITAGAAGMYCGTCMHDNTLAAALIREGHDVSLIPIYTPIRTDEEDVSTGEVFYGAINVFLEQKTALFRHTPWLVDRLLTNPKLLEWVSKKGSNIDARELGELTLSVLRGEDGKQAKELERLVAWLRDDLKPDIVQLTNSMLLGMAHRIKEEVGVPVVCAVQGEDIFFDDLVEPHKTQIMETLKNKARDADAFLAASRFYADHMAGLLDVPADSIDCIPLGLKLEGHRPAEPLPGDAPFTIGYLARICPEKGLHLLLDGFRKLADRVGRESVRLRVAGYLGERDRVYYDGLVAQIEAWGLIESIDLVGEIDRDDKIDFLHSVHVLSVPTVYREPKGLFVLEALANGVPVVQPAHGSFPEMLDELGGGVLFEPGDSAGLADAFEGLMNDRAGLERLGEQGRRKMLDGRDDVTMAQRTIEFYERVIAGGDGA